MIWSWTMLPALPSTRARKERPKHIWESCGNGTLHPSSPLLSAAGGKLMAENKILVQIIDHENGNSVLGQDHFESREKAEEFKRISDRSYSKPLGEGQTRITTAFIERWHQPSFPITATELCRSDTSSRVLFYAVFGQEVNLKSGVQYQTADIPADFRFDYESPRNCGGTVSFDHFWSNVIGFIEHGGPLIFEHTHLCARRTFLSTVYISPKLGTPFLMKSV